MLRPVEQTDHDKDQGAVDKFVADVGAKVRLARTHSKISRRELSELSGISERYLAQLETGTSNISVALLFKIANALNKTPDWFLANQADDNTEELLRHYRSANIIIREKVLELLASNQSSPEKADRICLIGLRGAGKSTLGKLLSDELHFEFVELNKRIEAESGIPVSEVMALYGQEGYRQLEKQAVDKLADQDTKMVLAVGGGIVSEPETYEKILTSFHSIWLKALPQEHMQRVRDQGDYRPMAGNPNAMNELKSILTTREAEYARADIVVDTSGKTLKQSQAMLLDAVRDLILQE
ncbi:MAG: helix-turn-helix transcriptional regulator [Pseudomonadota bacterium]